MGLFLLFFACSNPKDGGAPVDTDSGAAVLEVTDFTSSACLSNLTDTSMTMDTSTPTTPSITATSPSAGTVHVAHTSLSANCCTDIVPRPERAATTLNLSYDEQGDLCDCMCVFDVAYDIGGVPAGTYDVVYAELTTSVTVE